MIDNGLNRRGVLALGGAGLVGVLAYPVGRALDATTPSPAAGNAAAARHVVASSAAETIDAAVRKAITGATDHFYDPGRLAIRPTNGGGPFVRNGLVDYAINNPALWQRESFANVVFNEWQRTGDERLRQRLLEDWRAVKALYTPGQLIGMAGGQPSFRIVTTFDDACWLCNYLMHAHIAGAHDALGYLVEAIAYNTSRFTDQDTVHNPAITFVARTPNLANIDFASGAKAKSGASPGQTMTASRFGSVYTLPGADNYVGGYGRCSSSFEASMGLAALYVFERLGYTWMRDYAVHAQEFVRSSLLTPDPAATPDDPAHTPAEPALRKAQYLVETEFCLTAAVPSNDPHPTAFRPRNQWYGKPVRSLDSTYFGGLLAFCVLSARLNRLGLGDSLRQDAVNSASAIVSPQGYGRLVDGRTLVANTRDPHSEGHWAAPFAREVLALEGMPPGVRQAFVDTGLYMARTCLTADGYVTADWAGPELNPVTGRSTWDEDYAASPGAHAGHVQIMTTAESIAMLQGCAIAAT